MKELSILKVGFCHISISILLFYVVKHIWR